MYLSFLTSFDPVLVEKRRVYVVFQTITNGHITLSVSVLFWLWILPEGFSATRLSVVGFSVVGFSVFGFGVVDFGVVGFSVVDYGVVDFGFVGFGVVGFGDVASGIDVSEFESFHET